MKKLLLIILLLSSMGAMYYFTSQNGENSTHQSNTAIEVIDKVRDKVTLNNEKLIKVKDKVFDKLRLYGKSYVVRKAAHFSIYALIGTFAMLTLYTFSKRIMFSSIFALFIAAMYACYDEQRQLYIDGRGGSIKDVLIDTSGALTAIVILTILLSTTKGIKSLFSKSK